MLFSNMPTAVAMAAESMPESVAEKTLGSLILNTTVTGMLVVFSILVILVFIIYLYSKIVFSLTSSGQKKKSKKEKAEKKKEKPSVSQKVATPVPVAASPAPANGAVSGDIVAVIAAAVASMYPGFSVKSVHRVEAPNNTRSGRRSAWGRAGLSENTRSF